MQPERLRLSLPDGPSFDVAQFLTGPTATMRFHFGVPEAGWADVAFEATGRRYAFTVSYLSDAPRDILLAVAALLRGADESRVTFMQEPGEVVAVMRRLSGDRLRIKLFHGEDWGWADTDGDTPVFTADVSLEQFAGQVAAAFARLESEPGCQGYEAGWALYKFPEKALRDLRGLLRV